MKEEQDQEIKPIHQMEQGDYCTIDPAWPGQPTLFISRPGQSQEWLFISGHSAKTKLADILKMVLTCAALIVLSTFAHHRGYISFTLFAILAGLGFLGPVLLYLTNQRKTVIECQPWHLKLNRRDAFKSCKGSWKPDEIAGFRLTGSGLSAPATCTQSVFDLYLDLKDGRTVPLLNWMAYADLAWIAAGFSQILGLDLAYSQEASVTPKETFSIPTVSIPDKPDKQTIEVIEGMI